MLDMLFPGRSGGDSDEDSVTCHGIKLTRDDIKSVHKDGWLTDNIISLWETYIEKEIISRRQNVHIFLLRPSMALMLLRTEDPFTLRKVLPPFDRATHVFIPINDSTELRRDGGTHWSLLVISVIDRVAFHYDSVYLGNNNQAYQVTRNLGILMNSTFRYVNMVDSPQQANASDCGVFVCLEMRHLLIDRLLQTNSRDKISMSLASYKVHANAGRKEISKMIDHFRRRASPSK